MISVILTSYNKVPYIGTAIESVLDQTHKDLELIIVDDHSTDGAFKVCKLMAKNDKRIKLFVTDLGEDHSVITCNRYNHNINLAMLHSTGDRVSYLCDDDWYSPDRLERMNDFLENNPQVSCVYGKQGMIDDTDGRKLFMGVRPSPLMVDNAVCVIDHSSVMIRKRVMERIGGWPEDVESWRMGDAYFWNKLAANGYRFHLVPGDITDYHRYNKLSVSYALDHGTAPKIEQIKGICV